MQRLPQDLLPFIFEYVLSPGPISFSECIKLGKVCRLWKRIIESNHFVSLAQKLFNLPVHIQKAGPSSIVNFAANASKELQKNYEELAKTLSLPEDFSSLCDPQGNIELCVTLLDCISKELKRNIVILEEILALRAQTDDSEKKNQKLVALERQMRIELAPASKALSVFILLVAAQDIPIDLEVLDAKCNL